MSQHMTWQQRLRNDISAPFLCFFVLQAAFLLFCLLHPMAEIGMVDTIHQIGPWFILSWSEGSATVLVCKGKVRIF
jgi:hypothetical protein